MYSLLPAKIMKTLQGLTFEVRNAHVHASQHSFSPMECSCHLGPGNVAIQVLSQDYRNVKGRETQCSLWSAVAPTRLFYVLGLQRQIVFTARQRQSDSLTMSYSCFGRTRLDPENGAPLRVPFFFPTAQNIDKAINKGTTTHSLFGPSLIPRIAFWGKSLWW